MADRLGCGNPALLEAFNNVCLMIDRDIRAELLSEKPLGKDASTGTANDGPPGDHLAVIDKLQEENARLRKELAAMTATENDKSVPDCSKIASPLPQSASSVATSALEVPQGGHSELDVLKLRFIALDNNFKKARGALEKRKIEGDESRRREALLMSRIRAAEEQYGIQILDKGVDNPRVSASAPLDDEPMDLPPLPPLTIAAASDIPLVESDLLQSTQGDPEEDEPDLPPLRADGDETLIPVKREPSSDTPIFVSERVVKKRRREIDVAGFKEGPIVKDEPSDTDTVPRHERSEYPTQESLDLDQIAQRMTTPRKRRQADDVQRDRSPEQSSPLHTPVPYLSHTEEAPLRFRGEAARIQAASSILTPVSGNERPTRFADVNYTPSVKAGLSRGIDALAEDGSISSLGGLGALKRKRYKLNTPPLVEQGRLSRLLSKGMDEKANECEAVPSAASDMQGQFTFPERRELPFDQSIKQGKRNQVQAQTTSRGGVPDLKTPSRAASPHPGNTRTSLLRQKPLAELRLDDFKVNPAANKGHDFAFSEVVRDKDDRASLRGCTDMHCCGKQWRAMALSQRPDPPLTAAQRQEEQKLLEKYLGDCSYRLASMTKEERADLWLEAKTEELANRYGKHRHNFPRMQSPPGFWNADFPDTQQLQAEKEEAGQREKHAIAERHREAMRPGGRWLFRDE